MKSICTLIFTLVMLPSLTSQVGFISDFAQKWENTALYTIEFAEAFPEDLYDFGPTTEEMKFREQILHMCGNISWLSSSYLGGTDYKEDLSNPPKSKADLITILRNTFQYAAETIQNFDPSQLDEKVEFFAGPMSKRQIMMLMSDHVTHHRGQLVVYLRLNNIKPPGYRGW
jgi:uncharacterized damage-inducible protein DinB